MLKLEESTQLELDGIESRDVRAQALQALRKHKNLVATKEYYHRNKEAQRAAAVKRYYAKRDEILRKRRERRKVDPDFAQVTRERTRARASRNRESAARRAREYAQAHPEVYAEAARRRRAAYVAWADKALIKAVYAEAARLTRESGIPHEVDHVIPLRGKFVCGLHVHENLQIITKHANRKKFNTWRDDR